MPSRVRWFLIVAASACAIACARGVDSNQNEAPRDGWNTTLRFFRNPAQVPQFTVHDLDGRSLSSTDWRGKVVLINFWATWCGPCRAEIPALVALQERYRDRLFVLGVSEDEGPPDGVKRFATGLKINYPLAMLTPELERLFPGVGAIPTTFVLDRQSRLVQKHVGQATLEILHIQPKAQRREVLRIKIHQQHSQASESQIGSQIDRRGGLGCATFHRDE